jgi:hypothetical protein
MTCILTADPSSSAGNVDASFSSIRNRTGIDICLRDDEGAFVLAKTMSLSPMSSVLVGEALGLLYAMQWMQHMHFDSVDFVLDSKITTNAFRTRRIDVTEFSHVITTCRHLFSSFTNSRVEFNRRQANVVAHTLASETTLSANPTVYFEIPYCIETPLITDML